MNWVALAGQYDNVGDTLHRRVLLEFLRPLGPLHIHIGAAPTSFLSGLGLDGSEAIYTSSRKWAAAAYRAARKDTILAFAPGEMRLGSSRAWRELALAPLSRRIHGRGGRVVRIGIAAGNRWEFEGRLSELVLRSAITSSEVLLWREHRSYQLFESGSVVPDLGFGVLGDGLLNDTQRRGTLALTMRFDRPAPPKAWLDGVRSFAACNGLNIVVTSQVRRDNPYSDALATALNATADPWPDDRDHADQETHLRRLYKESALVVSDRLHALILGATEGAAAAGFATTENAKIPVHFDVLNLGIDNPPPGASKNAVREHLERAVRQTTLQNEAVYSAYSVLRDRVGASLSSAR